MTSDRRRLHYFITISITLFLGFAFAKFPAVISHGQSVTPTPTPRVGPGGTPISTATATPSPTVTPTPTPTPAPIQTLDDLQSKIRQRIFAPEVRRGRI